MEKFKEKIRIRTIYMSIIVICIAIVNFVLIINENNLPEIPEFAKGFQEGVFTGLELCLIFFLTINVVAIKNEQEMKKLYIKENDERTIMIKQKSGAIGIEICSIGLAFATVVAGFFNQIVFFSLLGATCFILFSRLFLKLYYHRKF